jgi:hypothetical protein
MSTRSIGIGLPVRGPITALAIGVVLTSAVVATGQEPQFLLEARAVACNALEGRGDIISAIQHGEEDTDELILENTAEWVPKFNAFASSEAARILRSYAEGALAGHEGSVYPEPVCRILEPAVAAAHSAQRVWGAGGKVEAGDFLNACDGGVCVPEAIDVVAGKCDFQVFAVPVTRPCDEIP